MDRRDVIRSVLEMVGAEADESTMTISYRFKDDDGEDVDTSVLRAKYEICDMCDGRGRYVNPSIDSQGLTSEDFDQDPDFRESYFAGHYDIQCAQCRGQRVTLAPDPAANSADAMRLWDEHVERAEGFAYEVARERAMGY